MRKAFTLLLTVLLLAVLVAPLPRSAEAWNAALLHTPLNEQEQRKPFVLELPEIRSGLITAPEVSIPNTNLRTIKLYVREPFAGKINYGKIYTAINGEASGTIQTITSNREGKVVVCDLESKPRFRFQPGKNVVEISATDRDGRTFYASYVLLTTNAQSGDGDGLTAGATIESLPVAAGADRSPPSVHLSQPRGAVRMLSPTATLKISGLATDDAGAVASVSVNGQAVSLSVAPATATRDLVLDVQSATASQTTGAVYFERTISVGAGATFIVVEAKDRAGNLTRIHIPLRRREAAVSSGFKGRKFALVIGVSRYRYHDGGLNDLTYADADARAVRDFLTRREGGNFAPSDIVYLENERATLAEVRASLTDFLPKAGPQDLIFIFIAGHGSPDPYAPQNLYFLLHDTKVADMPGTALPMRELQDALDKGLRAERIVVFVDACHSAGLSGEQMAATRGVENNLINLYASKLFAEGGRAVLTSSDVNELSREDKRWGGGHGVFTWALLEGLRGEADTNGDRFVTAGELFAFVRDGVRVATAFRQNPRVLPGGNADLALAFVPSR